MNSQLPEALLPLLADAAVGSTVILLAACVVTAALARSSAARRHWVWTLALFALLALPVLSVVLAPWSLHISMPEFARADGNKRADAPVRNLDRAVPALNEEALKPLLLAGQDPGPQVEPGPAGGAAAPAIVVAELPVIIEAAAPAPISWVVRAWLAGTALALCGLALGVVSLACLHRRCRPATEALGCLAAELSRELGIRRTVRLRLTAVRSMPMTWGILRPVVVLPDDAERWSSERQRLVLLHELAHVQRWDCLSQWLGHVARAVYWFQPLAWFALARLRAEQEHACDDVVLGHGAAAADYSEHLVAVTAGKATPLLGAHVALAISRSTRLHNRIRALLDPRRDRRPWRLPALVATTLCALLAASAAALLTLTPAAHAVQKPAEEAGKKDAAAPVPPTEGELLKKIAEIQRKLKEGYVEATDEKRLAAAAVRGLLDGLDDPYTSYLPADDLEQFKSQQQGALTGIGAQLTLVDGRVAVVTPLDDSPALKAGVRPGDIIDAVDGKPVREIKDAVQRILGPKGSEVKLKVIRPSGAVQEITITRGVVRLASALGFRRAADGRWSYELDPEQRIAYVRIQQFQKDTARELADAVKEEQDKRGLKGLILDLRNCPGGMLNEAVSAAKLFLNEGVIVTIRGSDKREHVFRADGAETLGTFPMVVLINEHTASAAEILAGALLDHGRAVLVGARTFGKGSVQSVVNLDAGGALRMTTAYHYLPSGRSMQKRPGEARWGVDPSDGFYVPTTQAQNEALLKGMRQRALLGVPRDEQPAAPARLTPKVLAEQHSDLALAAALRTLAARLTGGEFDKTGRSLEVQQVHLQRLEEMRSRREALVRSLQQLDDDIRLLQQQGTGAKKE